jgi:hypothetical protein
VAIASAVGVATVALVVVLSGGSPAPSPSGAPAAGDERAATAAATPSRRAREDCSTRSEAQFPGAFTGDGNLVVGPLVLIGGTYTEASTVRKFGGNKFPLLVKAGHTVTVQVAPRGRGVAGLAYRPLPKGRTVMRDTDTSVTFVACRPGSPSGSSADGVAVTFWSGFVLTRTPACVPLNIYVDEEPSPRRVGLSLGRRCPR